MRETSTPGTGAHRDDTLRIFELELRATALSLISMHTAVPLTNDLQWQCGGTATPLLTQGQLQCREAAIGTVVKNVYLEIGHRTNRNRLSTAAK